MRHRIPRPAQFVPSSLRRVDSWWVFLHAVCRHAGESHPISARDRTPSEFLYSFCINIKHTKSTFGTMPATRARPCTPRPKTILAPATFSAGSGVDNACSGSSRRSNGVRGRAHPRPPFFFPGRRTICATLRSRIPATTSAEQRQHTGRLGSDSPSSRPNAGIIRTTGANRFQSS